ncbi:NIF family HAD-type phosphatase [Nannocystaceae bacterium ST9]
MSIRWNKLLVLDLDDTLIHARSPSQAMLPWPPRRMVARYRLYLRPGAHEFVARALDRFAAVGIWTSASRDYARVMLSHFVGDLDRLAFVWSREQCEPVAPDEGHFLWHKDIARLIALGWSRERILIVDDKPEGLPGAEANVLTMPRFEGDPSDRELIRLSAYLDRLGPLADVTTIDKRFWWTKIALPTDPDERR